MYVFQLQWLTQSYLARSQYECIHMHILVPHVSCVVQWQHRSWSVSTVEGLCFWCKVVGGYPPNRWLGWSIEVLSLQSFWRICKCKFCLKINEAESKVLGVNTFEGFCSWSFKVLTLWFFLASDKVLTPCRFKFWVQPKVLGINTSLSTKLVGVRS